MKNFRIEIEVSGYDYLFKTYARDGVEAVMKVKCFLRRLDAECTIRIPKLTHVRENESCRMQVRKR